MATRYSKDKYARVKGLKNEPVSHLTLESKKRKLDEGKDETTAPLSIFGTPSSSTPSLEMMTSLLQPLVPKEKAKLVKVFGKTLPQLLDEPTMSSLMMSLRAFLLFHLMNQSTATFISGYFAQLPFVVIEIFTHVKDSASVLRFLENPYLSSEEKVVVTNSKVDFIEAESSKLRKDLTKAMDQATKTKEKVKELKDALKAEKMLVVQKDEEIQATFLKTGEECEKVITKLLESDRFFDLQFIQYFKGFKLLRRWMMKHQNQVVNFSNLDFEAINTKILAYETQEKEGEAIAAIVVEGDNATVGGPVDKGHVKEVVTTP